MMMEKSITRCAVMLTGAGPGSAQNIPPLRSGIEGLVLNFRHGAQFEFMRQGVEGRGMEIGKRGEGRQFFPLVVVVVVIVVVIVIGGENGRSRQGKVAWCRRRVKSPLEY